VIRELWTSAPGTFIVSGRDASATGSGAQWLTQDRCDGTLVDAVKGRVTVTPSVHPREHRVVRPGHHLLISARRGA
jgi:ferric-dicitrate binding protein FerR (iron transport regulator)